MQEGILQGVRVVEWGDLVSGPWTARLLADMGADVIKIEAPDSGDSARRVGPFPQDVPHIEKSGLYMYLNCNKRGVTLDVGKAEGKRIFRELVADADVLIESHSPGVVEELGAHLRRPQVLRTQSWSWCPSAHSGRQARTATTLAASLCSSTWEASATRHRPATWTEPGEENLR